MQLNLEKYKNFLSVNFQFLVVKFSVYLNRYVFVMSWHNHVDAMAAKSSKTLGFLRRNLSECTKEVKRTAYTALVRPIMEYASLAWDPSSSEDVTKLEKVQ